MACTDLTVYYCIQNIACTCTDMFKPYQEHGSTHHTPRCEEMQDRCTSHIGMGRGVALQDTELYCKS